MIEVTMPLDKLRNWAEKTPNNFALHTRNGAGWESVKWSEYLRNVESVAKALLTFGIRKGECVVIIGNNRAEWLYAQFGIMAAGGIATPSYQTNTAEQLAYLINHSKARFVFAENQSQYEKLVASRSELPTLEKVILFDEVNDADPDWTILFSDFLKLGKDGDEARFQERLKSIAPDDTAFVIYTSGTTGVPKAVMSTHYHLSYVGETLMRRFEMKVPSRAISYLPLSHIAEQIATNNLQLETGGEVYLCSDALLMKDYLPLVRPNVLLGVPRVWEKVESALKGIIEGSTGFKKMLLKWGLKTELAAFDEEQLTGKPVTSLSRKLANRLVVSKIKSKLGMDQILLAFIGAAPSNLDNLRFFTSLGIQINEVYGMTETTGIIATTSPSNRKFGTVGKPLEGVELKIAADGEILARGPALTKGYMHMPEATAELWEGGWLHTGDVGEFDADGNLKIIDRKKDLIITAGAKNVAPQPIEAMLKRIDGISQAVLIGDKKPYLIALVTADSLAVESMNLKLGTRAKNVAELAFSEVFQKYVSAQIEAVNAKVAKFERIGRFKVLVRDFAVETGELTPTMKMKRKVVNEMYAKEIEEVYAS
ncbi:MAG: long-chain fatty acid--CoA ligase [Flavobacteriales bacterium]|nr:long-chain fatty acid--CoA ligase [Flavobacteriales bacterium]